MTHRPKFGEKLFFFLSGAIISTPFPILVNSLASYFLIFKLPTFAGLVISLSIVGPLLEEFAKAYPLFYRHGETEKSLVGLGFLAGLGFGIAEFLFYVFFLKTPVFIRIPPLFFHAANTSLVAYGISQNKPGRFYLLAVFLHFLNNFTALLGGFWFIFGIVATLTSYALAWLFYKKAKEKNIDFWI